MFSQARVELRELIDLTHKIADWDASLRGDRSIEPTAEAYERRNGWERRKLELMAKYELDRPGRPG